MIFPQSVRSSGNKAAASGPDRAGSDRGKGFNKSIMKIGKLPETVLERSVIRQIRHRRNEVLMGPAVGVDCAAVEARDGDVFTFSTDPITGTVHDLGAHCIYVTANDLAASGAEPVGVMLSVLLPPDTEESAVRKIVQDADRVCEGLGIEILGGHTEVTNAVRQILITVTGIGRIRKAELLLPDRAEPGDSIVISKWVGLEATSILAKEREKELLGRFSPELIRTAAGFDRYLSVVEDAEIAKKAGVKLMHDITEGGVFGALWEIGEATGCGLTADVRSIPIRQETVEICEFFDVNPYQIMSSGSMLMIAPDGGRLVRALGERGIHAAVIGRLTEGNDRILTNQGETRYLERPKPDELYRALGESES